MSYDDQLFKIFYQSHLRQDVELDQTSSEDDAFRRRKRQHFEIWRDNPDAIWIIVERDGAPIAYAATDYNPKTKRLGAGDIAVEQSWRGRGIGKELIAKMKEKALELNGKSIGLTVHKDNAEARSLYEKAGFEYEDNPYLDMILSLDR